MLLQTILFSFLHFRSDRISLATMAASLTIADIVKRLNMLPHPEGGFFVETFRDDSVTLSLDNLPKDVGCA